MTSRTLPRPLASCIAALAVSATAHAAIYNWAGTGTATGPTGGEWNTTTPNLWTTSTGAGNSPWLQTSGTAALHAAAFGGPDGSYSLTLATGIAANRLQFSASGYTLSAAAPQTLSITGTPNGGGAASTTNLNLILDAGKTVTIGNNVTVEVATSNNFYSGISGGAAGGTLIIDSGGRFRQPATRAWVFLGGGTQFNVKTGGVMEHTGSAGGSIIFGAVADDNVTLNIDGGIFNTTAASSSVFIGQSNNANAVTATINVNSGAFTMAAGNNELRFGSSAGTNLTGTVNLNGGVMSVNRVTNTGTGGSVSTFNFNGGTLRAQSAGPAATFMSGLTSANVRNGGAVIDTNGLATSIVQALAHTIIGGDNAIDGGLTKVGAGTLTLLGANDYTGGTRINGGALQFESGALPGIGPVTINAGGALNAVGTYFGVNDWLASDRVDPASAGAIAITFDSSEDMSFTGFTNLMLGASADSNFTGTIAPAAATYRLGGGGAVLTLPNENTLIGANSLVVGAVGSSGTVILGSSNSYTGPTTVNGGTLLINGSISGTTTTVNAGATLGGSGTLGAVHVVGGTLAPGSSAGTLTTGALTLDSTSIVKFELTAGDPTIGSGINDLTIVNGVFTLDGTLQVTEVGGSLSDDIYTLFDYIGSLVDNGLDLDPTFLAAHPSAAIVIDSANTRVLLSIPEPGSALTLLGAAVALLGLRRRRVIA